MSSKGSSTRQSKTPLHHLKSKKWCFPPSPLRQSSTTGSASGSPSKSPEPNCAICLGKIEDKSFTDRCFHCFCRLCLFEWAKVKAECPVCRQGFEKIIFNIRAMDDYDEHIIQTSHRHRYAPFAPFGYQTPFVNLDGNPRFRYPTTLTPLRRRMMDFERRLQIQLQMSDYAHSLDRFQNIPHFLDFLDNNRRTSSQRSRSAAISNAVNNNNNSLRNSSTTHSYNPSTSRPSVQTIGLNDRFRYSGEDPMVSGQSSRPWNPSFYSNPFELDIFPPPAGTSAHRRYIYDSDLWVLTNGDGNTSRTREVSARFFSSNPACTHRLIPWLNRELNSILPNPNETEVLIPRIMNALLMFDIRSIGFKKIIAPFITNKTNHFIHEFYNFARSPYDMEQYTRHAVYVPRHRADIVESEPLPAPIGFHVESNSPNQSSPDSSSGSSIEILNQPFTRIRDSSTNTEMPSIISPPSPTIYSIDGSDSDESSTEIRQLITPSPVNTPSLHETNDESRSRANNDISSTSNPTPLPRGDLPDVNFGNINIIDDFDNPKPGTSGLRMSGSSRMRTPAQTKWSDSDTTDVDVGEELEAAIARFENNDNKPEVKKEFKTESKPNEMDVNESDTSCSSVLIVGYVKPLHERTPQFVDLISSDEQKFNRDRDDRDISGKYKKQKRDDKHKHRKRWSGRSHSQTSNNETHSHNKRKCKHKSRDRSQKHKDKARHKHKTSRVSKRRSSSSSSSSSSTSSFSSSDELRQLNKSFKNRQMKHKKHRKQGSDSKHTKPETDRESRFIDDQIRKTITSTTTSSSRPSSLGSVVILKQPPIQSQSFKVNRFYVYSDSD